MSSVNTDAFTGVYNIENNNRRKDRPVKKQKIMIRLNVFIQVEEANRAAVLEEAKALTEASLKEEGCVAYDIFESATRPDVMMICETWKDEEVLAAHSKSRHFILHVGKIEKLAKMKLEKFNF